MNGIPIDLNTVLMVMWFCICALIGGVAYVFFWSIKDRNEVIRHLVLAVLAGFIYYQIYIRYNVPNSFVSIVVGWFAPDFIEAIMEKYRPEKPDIT